MKWACLWGHRHEQGVSFKLIDFDIEPPVALAGALRIGDAVSLEFTLVFEARNSGG